MSQHGNTITRRIRRGRRAFWSLPFVGPCVVIMTAVLVSACAGVNDNGTQMRALETREAREAAAPPPVEAAPVEIPEDAVEELAAAGEELSAELGCTGCHSVTGEELAGPTWLGLFGSEIPLESGETVVADEDYIVESIVAPGAQIHEGYQPIMPNAYTDLGEEQLAALVAYIMVLGEEPE